MPTSSDVTFDMKKMARDTTFHLTVRMKHMRWYRIRMWIVRQFASLTKFLLGNDVEIEFDCDYSPTRHL